MPSVPICCLLLLLMSCTGSQMNADQGTSQSGGQETTAPAAAGQGRWSEAARLPVGRSETAVTQTDEAMYVLGGYTPETKTSTLVTSYDPKNDVWQELAPLPKGLNHIASAARSTPSAASPSRTGVPSTPLTSTTHRATPGRNSRRCPPRAALQLQSRSMAGCTL